MSGDSKSLRKLITSMQEDQNGFMEMLMNALLNIKNVKKLKYDEKELELIEDKINEMFPVGHKPLATTLIPFGFYLGEYLIRKIPGAIWKFPDDGKIEESIWDICIEFKTSEGLLMNAKPFMRAKKYWLNREDKMSTLARVMCFNSEISMDPEYWSKRADDNGWITMAWGDMFRMFQGDKKTIKDDYSNAKGVFHKGEFGDGK